MQSWEGEVKEGQLRERCGCSSHPWLPPRSEHWPSSATTVLAVPPQQLCDTALAVTSVKGKQQSWTQGCIMDHIPWCALFTGSHCCAGCLFCICIKSVSFTSSTYLFNFKHLPFFSCTGLRSWKRHLFNIHSTALHCTTENFHFELFGCWFLKIITCHNDQYCFMI